MSDKYDLIKMFNWMRRQTEPFSPYLFEKEFGMHRNSSKTWFRNTNIFAPTPYENGAIRYQVLASATLDDFVAAVAGRKRRLQAEPNKVIKNSLGEFDFTTPKTPQRFKDAHHFIAVNWGELTQAINVVTGPDNIDAYNDEACKTVIRTLANAYPVFEVLKQIAVLYASDPRLVDSADGIAKLILTTPISER